MKIIDAKDKQDFIKQYYKSCRKQTFLPNLWNKFTKIYFHIIIYILIGGITSMVTIAFIPAALPFTKYEVKTIYLPTINISKENKEFMNAISLFESNGNYLARRVNSQYLGRYQIGDAARVSIGLGGLNTKFGYEQFIRNPQLQDIAMYMYMEYNRRILKNYILRYKDTKVGSYFLTESGIIAMAHSCGANGVIIFINSKGKIIPKDGNNKPATDYLQFNNYKLN